MADKKTGMFNELKRKVTLTAKQLVTVVKNYNNFRKAWKAGTFKFRLSEEGNTKVGAIATWSTLLGDYTYHGLGKMFNGIKGTCNNCRACGCVLSCYVRSSYRFASVVLSQAINTWGLRNHLDKVESDIAEQLSKGNIAVVRINQSGELENAEQLAMWCRLAAAFPKIPFYVYTKNFELVADFLDKNLIPKSFTVLFSVWHSTGVAEFNRYKGHPNVKAFVYDDDKELILTPKAYCPAYKDGKMDHEWTCERCGLCFRSKVKIVGCKDH